MSRTIPQRRSRRRSNQARVSSVLLKGGATIGVMLLFVAFAVTVQEGVPTKDYSTMYVEAGESGSLRGNDKVAIGGVRVGRVVGVESSRGGARVELQLEPGVTLPQDTKVRIRANGLLGARYVQLIPGSDRARLADGSTIKGGRDVLSSTVPDALDVFNAETRGALGATVTGLGRGMLGNGEPLNDAIRVASDATTPFEGIMRRINDVGEPEQLLPSLDAGMTALDGAREDLARMLGPAADALEPFSDRRDALRATLTEAPSTLTAATGGLGSGTRLLAATGDLARSAHRTLPSAPDGLRQATALLREARSDRGKNGSPLEQARKLLRTAGPAVPDALKVTSALKPVLPNLTDALGSLTPVVQHVGRHACDFINTGVVLRSMTGFTGTGTGPNGPSSQFRLQAATGLEPLGVKEPAQTRDAYYQPCTYLGREYQTPTSALTRRPR